jgi:hypothetical protein
MTIRSFVLIGVLWLLTIFGVADLHLMISNCLAPFYAAFHGIPQSVFETFHEQMDLRAVSGSCAVLRQKTFEP